METKTIIFILIGIALTSGYVYSSWNGNSNSEPNEHNHLSKRQKKSNEQSSKKSIFGRFTQPIKSEEQEDDICRFDISKFRKTDSKREH